MRSLSLVMSECCLSGRGQGHVSNFYIVDYENFATASRRYTGMQRSDGWPYWRTLHTLRLFLPHNSAVIGLFMTPIRQRKRLECVTVECTYLLHIGPP